MHGGRGSGRREPRRPPGPPPGRRALAQRDCRARRGRGERLQRDEAGGGAADRRGEFRSPRLGGKQRTEPGPSPARAGATAAARTLAAPGRVGSAASATHQDALEKVALLGRQLHVRHRGRRGGRVLGRCVSRGWAPGRAVAKSRAAGDGSVHGLELRPLGRAGNGKGTRPGLGTLRSRAADRRAAAEAPARSKMAAEARPLERVVCACAGRPAARGGGGLRAAGPRCAVLGRFCHPHLGAPRKSLIVLCSDC